MTGKITVGIIQDTDGNTVASTYVTNGSAKGWLHYEQYTAGVIRDSLNMGSVTDVSAGKFKLNYANNFSNGYYSASGACGLKHLQIRYGVSLGPTTSKIDINSSDGANTDTDYYYNCVTVNGDLA